jgi:predicted ATPase
LGYPERAREQSDTAIGLSQELGHSGTLIISTESRLILSACQRDHHDVAQQTKVLLELYRVEQTDDMVSWTNAARGWAMFEQGEREAGMGMMQESVMTEIWEDPWSASLISLMAVALGQHADVDEGLELMNESLRLCQRDDVHWWEAELHRVKGELLLMDTPDDPGNAEGWFKQAIEIARVQGAKSLELRAAVSLARLWQERGIRGEARDILAPVFEWFTEGFDTPDLIKAKKVLAELA